MAEEQAWTILDDIVAARRRALGETRRAVPLERVQLAAVARQERRDFASAISSGTQAPTQKGIRVIAELKRASPTRGLLRQPYRRREISQGYVAGGARAISVLTEEQHFLGSLRDLTEVREAVEVPVLRKDFILNSYQVYESVAAGADALLLIAAVLPDRDLQSLIELSKQLRVESLVEVHTEQELERALVAGARTVGVNNRNLRTLEVNLETSFRLREKIPSGCIAVSESGVKTSADLRRLSEARFDAVLMGERLMLEADPGDALRALLAGMRVPAMP